MSQIEARILQQDYVLTCPEGQEEVLLAAVQRVDEDMERIRNTGKVRARERVGVLSAVNLAFENATLYARIQELERELELALESAAASPALGDEPLSEAAAQELTAELEGMLTLRERELQEAQQLRERLDAVLEAENKLL